VVTEGGGVARYQQGVFRKLLPETTPARTEEVRPAFYESRCGQLWISLKYGCVHRWDGHTLDALEAPPECAESVLVPVGLS